MGTDKSFIPADLDSVKNIGLNTWLPNYKSPLSWPELIDLEDGIKKILNHRIKTDTDVDHAILISYKIFIEYSNFIYGLIAIKRGLNFSSKNTYFHSIKKNGVPQNPIISFPKLKNKTSPIRKKYRVLKKLLLDNKLHLFNPFLKRYYVLTESRSNHTLEYLKEQKKGLIVSKSFYEIYDEKNVKPLEEPSKKVIEETSLLIVDDLNELLVAHYDLQFSESQKNYLREVTNDVLSNSLQVLKAVEIKLKNKKIKLYLGSNNSFMSRILSVVIRKNGGEVHGFSHGEPLVYNWDKISWMELSLNNYFYEYTPSLAQELKRAVENNYSFHNKAVIRSFDSSLFTEFYKSNVVQEKNTPSKKVMLIGNAYKETGISSVTAPYAIMQLQIEMEILSKLKELSITVMYKKHPGGYFSKTNLPFSGDDQISIIEQPFEMSIQDADVFIFYYTRTTTFGHALASKKKIIVIDMGVEVIPEEILNTLKKQCYFIRATLDAGNRYSIDKRELENCLHSKGKEAAFYKTYLKSE